jgi:oxygen-dependent protoporphyrinogen oxidase
MSRPEAPHLLVVGGGITGLAAAWEGVRAGARVTLVEADDRMGGKVRTEPFCDRPLDTGPDAFLARVPEARALAEEIGLGGDLIAPAATAASVWVGHRLHRLPTGLVLGVPTDLPALVRSGICSPLGVARAALDLVLPGEAPTTDVAVGALVRRRLGRQVFERLVDPLLGGINAGRSDHLSLLAGVPQLAGALDRRSLILGARAHRQPGPTGSPVFLTTAGGLGRLVDRLAQRLVEAGAVLRTGWAAAGLEAADGGWRLWRAQNRPDGTIDAETADAVVLATPARPTAVLLAAVAPTAVGELVGIEHASVAIVALAYPVTSLGHRLDGSGFLVPRRQGWLMTACSWASSKWPGVAPAGTAVLRVSAGRAGDRRALRLSDEDLVRRLHAEVRTAMGAGGEPSAWRVSRWPDGFPQYAPGHLDKVARIEAALPAGVEVAGATYRGVGIPACVRQGRAAAVRALAATTS